MGKTKKINQTIRKSAEGVLDFSDGEIKIDIEDIGEISFRDLFKNFNGENVKVVVSVSNEGDSEDGG